MRRARFPLIFSGADDQQDADDQQPRDKKRKSAQPPAVEKSVRTVQTRTKIILQTTKSPAVETAYTEQSPLEQQWRLSSLFGIRNAANPTLDQPLSSVAGIEMDKPGYQEVVRAAKIHEVPVELALRVAKQESRGNCGAKSSGGRARRDAGHAAHRRQARLLEPPAERLPQRRRGRRQGAQAPAPAVGRRHQANLDRLQLRRALHVRPPLEITNGNSQLHQGRDAELEPFRET